MKHQGAPHELRPKKDATEESPPFMDTIRQRGGKGHKNKSADADWELFSNSLKWECKVGPKKITNIKKVPPPLT